MHCTKEPCLALAYSLTFRGRVLVHHNGAQTLGMVNTASNFQGSANRSPKRIATSISYSILEIFTKRSNEEGRSQSNLAGFALEQGIKR